ncbi:MAG: alpha/beta fold hydrolase [Aggregatilineales bacterium]
MFKQVSRFFVAMMILIVLTISAGAQGFLTTVQDRANPDELEIYIHVMILEATGSNPNPIPVVYLEGGPGGGAFGQLDSMINHPVRQQHDIILIDQRGTGFSDPLMNCPEIEQGTSDNPVAECRDRLISEGIDLQDYSSANSATDVKEVVEALGHEQVHLWGNSYGTKLALTIMRDHPQIVRSAVIDSVFALETDDWAIEGPALLDSVEMLIALCTEDAACSSAYPNFEQTLASVIEAEEPFVGQITNDNDELEELELYGMDVLNMLFGAFYITPTIGYLPYGIDLIANSNGDDGMLEEGYYVLKGDYRPGEAENMTESVVDGNETVDEYFEEFGDFMMSEGMGFSVDCQEEDLLADEAMALEILDPLPDVFYDMSLDSMYGDITNCESWGVDPADLIENERVISDIPTLITSGAFDPATPVSSGDSVLKGLSNGIHIIFPNGGHGITLTDTPSGECAKSIVVEFLSNPDTAPDTSCVAATGAVQFYTP